MSWCTEKHLHRKSAGDSPLPVTGSDAGLPEPYRHHDGQVPGLSKGGGAPPQAPGGFLDKTKGLPLSFLEMLSLLSLDTENTCPFPSMGLKILSLCCLQCGLTSPRFTRAPHSLPCSHAGLLWKFSFPPWFLTYLK